ncbi:exported hypothetical protein [Nostocoides australiense Ben110]|uniref:Uncharacterized protein n=1 Tax=Nostocoides australiense Ben110 TaxID=1193182 RepID=W6JVV4_9MICO|nr:hypothetical protein [Tetrasphaera australiensis]MCA0290568.1 hypothetical protein [Actinomycetota bacterium]MCB1301829.1 hypothetical protein [Tetrasphaera sp.]CCH73648.1 exported hypothetical protein [Tetrasphaera australiensis Ben110]HRW02411.1 hypothetical protein [Tetrasphaera sp.]
MGRLILPTLVLLGILAAAVLLSQGRGGGAPGPGSDSNVLGGDPDGARAIQDARASAPPSPRQEAWRWTLTVLGILIVSAAVILGIALIAKSLWDL